METGSSQEVKPQDRVPATQMVVYGLGAFVNNLLAGALGAMMIVLNLGLGMNPALVGLLGLVPRLFDAFTDPLVGYLSDKTRSRWGRRRPYIFVGAITAGLIFMLLWQLPRGQSEAFYFWYFLGISLVFFLAYTVLATPWVALGYEMTPDYNERTRLMGVQNFIAQLAFFVPPWLLLLMQYEVLFDDMVDGAAAVSIIIGLFVIGVGVLPAIFIRERALPDMPPSLPSGETRPSGMFDFLRGAVTALSFGPFLKLCAAAFLIFNGFILISAFQTYVLIYYVFSGDTVQGGLYAGYAGTVSTAATFGVVVFVTWLGTRIGKRRTLMLSTAISIIGFALKWVSYNPDYPLLILLPAPLIAFGLGGLFTIIPSMIADVVDYDELNTAQRREGMYGSIFWWVIKLGLALALLGGGVLLNATGFDVALQGEQTERTLFLLRVFDVGVPLVSSAIALWAIASFSITPQRAHEIRQELEARRGIRAAPAAVLAPQT